MATNLSFHRHEFATFFHEVSIVNNLIQTNNYRAVHNEKEIGLRMEIIFEQEYLTRVHLHLGTNRKQKEKVDASVFLLEHDGWVMLESKTTLTSHSVIMQYLIEGE